MEGTPENGWPHGIVNQRSNIHMQNEVVDTNKKPTAFKSVFRTANVLTCLSKGVTSVTDIASICKIHKSTVHRLLQALGEAGLTMQDPISRRYYIGPLITEIASNPYVTHEHLVSCAINEMVSLSSFTCESIGLNVLIGLQNVLLHEIPSSHDLQLIAKKKISGQIHAGANSKVLLSQLYNKELKIVMTNLAFEPITEHTVTDKQQLMAQLKQIRRQGYAISYGERISGGIAMSVPIKNYILPASISILGPESRIKPRITDFLNELIAASTRVSQNLSRVFKIK